MKNLSLFTLQSYLRGFLLCALVLANGFRMSAQYDLLYENHEQDQVRWVRAIADDGQGNTYLAGKFAVSLTLGTFTLTNTGDNVPGGTGGTGFVGKFNSASNSWLWAKKIALQPGSGQLTWVTHSDIMDLTIDNAGNVYVTGSYSGVVSFDHITLSSTKQGSQHTPDIFVAKYNTNGNIVWAKSYGSKAGHDAGNTIALDGSNNIFIGGNFTNRIENCNGPFQTATLYDIYLAKLNNAGTAQWQKRYANLNADCSSHYNSGSDVFVDPSGNVFLEGQFKGTISFGTGSALTISSINSTLDVFAAKVNSSGTTQWVKASGGSSHDYGNAIHVDASGNAYTGGRIGTDAFLSKYNSSGNLVWSVNPYPASPAFPSNSIIRINPYSNSILVYDSGVGF